MAVLVPASASYLEARSEVTSWRSSSAKADDPVTASGLKCHARAAAYWMPRTQASEATPLSKRLWGMTANAARHPWRRLNFNTRLPLFPITSVMTSWRSFWKKGFDSFGSSIVLPWGTSA